MNELELVVLKGDIPEQGLARGRRPASHDALAWHNENRIAPIAARRL